MARDHGSIALYARCARPKGHLFFPFVRPQTLPNKETQLKTAPRLSS